MEQKREPAVSKPAAVDPWPEDTRRKKNERIWEMTKVLAAGDDRVCTNITATKSWAADIVAKATALVDAQP